MSEKCQKQTSSAKLSRGRVGGGPLLDGRVLVLHAHPHDGVGAANSLNTASRLGNGLVHLPSGSSDIRLKA
jgi:hypothetical protein